MRVENAARPTCSIVGGSNGSGKSTIYAGLTLPGRLINADVVAATINPGHPEAVSFLAGRRTLADLTRTLAVRESFTYETTLSSHQSIELMRSARNVGYAVGLIFVALNSVDLNVQRVAERVARGGHLIPENVIRRRYETALARLPEAIGLADESLLFDNSLSSGPHLLMQVSAKSIVAANLDEADPFHCRLADLVKDALR